MKIKIVRRGWLCYVCCMDHVGGEARSIAELQSLDRGLEFLAAGSCPPPELIRLGLIPPLPLSDGELLWGFPVLDRAVELGLNRLACRRLPGLTRSERLDVALRLEARPGSYSWAEKLAMQRYLEGPAGNMEAGPALAALSPSIEGHLDPQLESRLKVYRTLPAYLREEVDRSRIDLKTALRVHRLPEPALRLVAQASLSYSERRELLHGLVELAGRQRLSAEAVAGLTHELLAARQPMKELENRRRPAVSDLRRRFEQICGPALAGSGVRLKAPPCFEGETYEVGFSFSSCRALARRLQGLARLAERCDELVELLG
jgi:hypothetical protein